MQPMESREALLATVAADPRLVAIHAVVAERMGADADPGHDLEHALRVARWTCALAPEVEPAEAIAAALLHDVINLPKDHPERAHASERSADLARRLLPEHGFDAPAVERIACAIRDHSFSRGATPESELGRALQDADRLEALGALGLCRTLSTGARMGAVYFHPSDPFAANRALDDLRHTVDHFFTKLLDLPSTMRTEAGRREAERRVAFLRSFLEQLAGEIGVPLPPTRS